MLEQKLIENNKKIEQIKQKRIKRRTWFQQ